MFRIEEDQALADVAITFQAPSLEQLFSDAADAFLAVQLTDYNSVKAEQATTVSLSRDMLDVLLYAFVQELVYWKDARRLFLRIKSCRVYERGGQWHLDAEMVGETLDPQRHSQVVDVKAATLHALRLEQTASDWCASLVLDI